MGPQGYLEYREFRQVFKRPDDQAVRGRNLEGGSMFQMIQSLRMISQLPDMTKIYPGHGVPTTIGTEIAGNPYMDR